ncbi:hypothetical protein [Flaviaesturariibacter aridisoli]|uniref:Uncharacterized protein n=1 Tax=Flaviaesturariibacter aridisoli TaxID=2545761 RepID=A0A4R4DVN4_9BACT|nr:hypothetical protein [Flaviaesturariibacter aridisoli]TCZ67706.1 hypothetical protein E0486_15200 [Flaviaesturariibacter aridisoli]
MRSLMLALLALLLAPASPAQLARHAVYVDTLPAGSAALRPGLRAFAATAGLLDAALTSLNSLQSLVSKDNYRNSVQALNNPASSALGFSLEGEIQSALQPVLAKTKTVSKTRFTDVVGALVQAPRPGSAMLLSSLAALVGNLAVQEKRVERADVDSFLQRVGRYFAPYEQLNSVNARFEQQVARMNGRLIELQFDIREYMLDIVLLLHPGESRAALRTRPMEELLLQYLDGPVLESLDTARRLPPYPGDGVKGAKDICSNVQKVFREYQKLYGDNYNEIRAIVQAARALGRSGSGATTDATLKSLETLYTESAQADALNLRLRTLEGRLAALVSSTQVLAR